MAFQTAVVSVQNAWQSLRVARLARWWLVFYLAAASLFVFGLFSTWAYDDPFITYRYAHNLARGWGFVYNPGERVLSTTTPLFTLLLVIPARLGLNLPLVARLIGAASLAAGGLLLWDLAETLKLRPVGLAGLALYPTFPMVVTSLGSETPLYLTLCLGSFALYFRGRHAPAALLLGLAVLARPDGFLVAVLLAGDYLIRRRGPLPWRALAVFLGILGTWALFAWLYFGSPLPVTLAAKQGQGGMAISERFAPGFLTIVRWYFSWPYALEAGLALAGSVYALRVARAWLLLLVWPLVYFAAYSALGVSRYFWYYAPLVPGFIAAVGLGLAAVGRLTGEALDAENNGHPFELRRWNALLASRVLSVLLVATLALAQGYSLWNLRRQADPRQAIYRAVGEWLQLNTETDSQVGTLEVGIIGYYADRPMVDFAGLIQPAISAQFTTQTTYQDSALFAVERYQPDILVLHDGLFGQLENGYVAGHCEVVQRFRGEGYRYSENLSVYACRE
ncbi:MAG TPA: hypothetical protein VJ436_03250 [Anaerolineales bacterium]|nr:hypothetical protein [Anaerolineales bacterium]